jgi:hypothetical protein
MWHPPESKMKGLSKAHVITIAVLVLALAIGLVRKTGWRPGFLAGGISQPSSPAAGSEPQDTVYAMLGAARAGNTKAYLASFAGPMESSLRQTLAESTEPGFAKYLKDTHAPIRGVAVSDLETSPNREAKVRVEYIYQDRNEVQVMYLEKGPGGWKITRADNDERIKTLIPYGTPVK